MMTEKTPEFSPKLKMAAKEIEDILVKYDISGIINLFEPMIAESIIKIDPSWSVVSLNAARHLKINPPIVDLKNQEAAKKKIIDTINMLANLRIRISEIIMALMQAEQAVRTRFGMNQKPQKQNGQMK